MNQAVAWDYPSYLSKPHGKSDFLREPPPSLFLRGEKNPRTAEVNKVFFMTLHGPFCLRGETP